MSVDFENTPLKDENGEVIKDVDGNPILYKYFLNDFPDPEHERIAEKNLVGDVIYMFLKFGTPIPESMNITEKQIEAGRKELELQS